MISKLEKALEAKPTQPETGVDKRAMNLAASWYIAMQSKALGKKPTAIELFGQPLVAWRDEKGYPVIMERYCSHMGASLAIGKVTEGCLQCPFHHWRYDNSGQCISIPEVEHIPPTARQATYVTAERYGFIWVWYGSETPLFPLPEFSAAEDERHNYMPLRFAFNTKTTVRRVLENAYDYSHMAPLHDLKVADSMQLTLLDDQHPEPQSELPLKKEAYFRALIQGGIERYLGLIGAVAQALGLNAEAITLQFETWPSGHLITAFINDEEKWKLLSGITPIAENKTILQVLIMVKKTGKFWLDIPYYLVFGWQTKASAAQDIPVWNTMQPDAGGAYVKHDQGVLKLREFYQSWVDKAE